VCIYPLWSLYHTAFPITYQCPDLARHAMAIFLAAVFLSLSVLFSAVRDACAEDFLSTFGSNWRIDLLGELDGAFGPNYRSVTEARLCSIKDALRPSFLTMPKSGDGRLDHAAVRYVLHRLFVERHGWSIKGLGSEGETWGSASPTQVLEHRVPSRIHGLFEERLDKHGLDLHEIAVMAVTLENLIHREAEARLAAAYMALSIERTDLLPETEVQDVVEVYMTMFLLGMNNSVTSEEVRAELATVHRAYPGFDETMIFARDVQRRALGRDISIYARIPFSDSLSVVEKIGEEFGQHQDKDCIKMKDTLVAMDHHGTGRVKLRDFYSRAVADPNLHDLENGSWQFSESVAYLRQLGALDENNPQDLSVIIANYVNSPANCIASSAFYSVCCIDECEVLLSFLEHGIAAPSATPADLASLVIEFPSPTVDAPREISQGLRRRLDEIAQHHGGQVPLHGRLFAQWMHHAYPRECPYPHTSGTTKPITEDQWFAQTGTETSATLEEMQQYMGKLVRSSSRPSVAFLEDDLPWAQEEELFVARVSSVRTGTHTVASCVGRCVMVVVLVSFAIAIERAFGRDIGNSEGEKQFCI